MSAQASLFSQPDRLSPAFRAEPPKRAPFLVGSARYDAFTLMDALLLERGLVKPRIARGLNTCSFCELPVGQHDPFLADTPHELAPPEQRTVMHAACHEAWWRERCDTVWTHIEATAAAAKEEEDHHGQG